MHNMFSAFSASLMSGRNGACGVRTIACLRPLCPWCKAPDGSLTPLGLGNLVYFYA